MRSDQNAILVKNNTSTNDLSQRVVADQIITENLDNVSGKWVDK